MHLNMKKGKHVNGAPKFWILGLAHKANVDDCRESPSFVLMEKLEAKGAKVEYHDSYVPVVPSNSRTCTIYWQAVGAKSRIAYDLILIVHRS